MKALIIVDVQNDFLPGGALEVPGSGNVVSVINHLQVNFDLVVATQDWHPENHMSFASNHYGKKAFDVLNVNGQDQTLWPDHCIQGSRGADFPAALSMKKIEAIFRKGTNPLIDSYSCFFDNNHQKSTGLAGYLNEKGFNNLYFCGLAADICVYYSILDALKLGFKATLLLTATHPLNRENFRSMKKELQSKGVSLIYTEGTSPQLLTQ